MKKRLLVFLTLLIVALMIIVGCANEDAGVESDTSSDQTDESGSTETVTLKLADVQPEGFPTVVAAEEFAKLVEEKTDGRYKIDVYPGGQLGDEKSVIEEVQLGSIELARVNGVPLTEFNDTVGVLNLPFLYESQEEKWEVWTSDIGEEILDSFLDSGMVGLAYYDNGERFFYSSKKPIKSLDDMKGLKIRVQESELAIDIAEALGVSANPMAYDEVYSAIQTGVIDGAENNFPSYYTSGHYEVANYAAIPGYQSVPEFLIGSKELWDSLSDEDKEAFKEAALESVEVQRKEWDELVVESREKIEEHGNEITELDDIEPWREAVEVVYEKHGEKYKDLLDRILE